MTAIETLCDCDEFTWMEVREEFIHQMNCLFGVQIKIGGEIEETLTGILKLSTKLNLNKAMQKNGVKKITNRRLIGTRGIKTSYLK